MHVTPADGNVFADIGLPDAEELRAKADLMITLTRIIRERKLTQAQATRGHQLFNNLCAQCHRPDLTGAAGPALVGQSFLATWGNKPLSDLYMFEHTKMPAVNPYSVLFASSIASSSDTTSPTTVIGTNSSSEKSGWLVGRPSITVGSTK